MTVRSMSRILVAGGVRDPNVHTVLAAAEARGVETVPLLIGEGRNPSLTWDLDSDDLRLDGKRVAVTGVFARQDVFHGGGPHACYRALAWYTTLQGWLAVCSRIRVLNRGYLGRHTNKLHTLRLARAAGLKVPATVVTNEVGSLARSRQAGETIAKPVPGGGYCKPINELLADTELCDGIAASPAIVQDRLSGPDLRIYGINGGCMGFRIQADAVDYRESRNRNIEWIDHLPGSTVEGLGRLMASMGLDWCAADFKAHPESGDLTFLEINSNPMFSVFDRVGRGAIADAIVQFLSS
jgi:hypothetical protein